MYSRERMRAHFEDDDALRTLLQTTVREVLEAEMGDALARAGANA